MKVIQEAMIQGDSYQDKLKQIQMAIDNAKTAAVDNDFINHVSDTRMTYKELVETLKIVFTELDLTAIVHPLVYEKEVLHNN